jgi:hypothetical protein
MAFKTKQRQNFTNLKNFTIPEEISSLSPFLDFQNPTFNSSKIVRFTHKQCLYANLFATFFYVFMPP